ncbi:alpha/beta fold hydrolase [Cryomorphaceae bacterium 1068]|nr:alpha/beta fold hydrolase [Cryomorphaceae bacterium 1068]
MLIAIYVGVCIFYYVFQERFIFVPLGTLREDFPIELGTDFSEVFLDGVEGGRIHALHIKVANPRGCILYFHGNTGHITRWGPIAEELTSFGFDVLVPDYRGYGKSHGIRSQETLCADALLCYDYLKKSYPENMICLYGRSLGSAMASWLAGRTNSGGVILETPFNNLRDVAAYHTKIIPVGVLLKYGFRNELHLKHCKSPILIAHGTKDIIVPYRCGFSLFKTAKPLAEMVTIPGGHHSDLNGYPLFREKLQAFFDKYFFEKEEEE